jgi:hypothetical protein
MVANAFDSLSGFPHKFSDNASYAGHEIGACSFVSIIGFTAIFRWHGGRHVFENFLKTQGVHL